jgi:hypothetical protein
MLKFPFPSFTKTNFGSGSSLLRTKSRWPLLIISAKDPNSSWWLYSEAQARREVSLAITKKDSAGHWPMTSLNQRYVQMPITVEVADAGVGGGFRNCL